MLKMKQKIKRVIFSAIAVVASTCSLFTSVAFATEGNEKVYEDLYAKDGIVGMRDSEEFLAIYELNNHLNENIDIDAILYFVVQDEDNVIQNDFLYKFEGSFAPVDEWGTHGFEVDLGMPIEYNPLSEIELNGEKATIYQTQFGIYPGYYAFHNYGYNYLGRSSDNVCYIKTLSPNWVLDEKDRYTKSQWVEISETSTNPRLYALIGEKDWIEKVGASFEDWAIEYESKVMKNIVGVGEQEEVEVIVPEENKEAMLEKVEEIMENQEIVIEEEIPDVFVEKEPEVPVEEKETSPIVIVLLVVAILAIFVFIFYCFISMIKAKTNKY